MQQPPSHGVGEAGSELRADTSSPASTTSASSPNRTSETAGDTASELRSDARQLGSTAANRVHSEIDSRKGKAADQAHSVSSAIDRAAGELDDGSPEWLRSAFRQGAQQVQRFADAIEQKDSRELMREVQDFARERPGTFLAACAAAGFAAARIFKAGGEPSPSGQRQQPRSSFEPGFQNETAQRGGQSEPAFTPSPRGEFA